MACAPLWLVALALLSTCPGLGFGACISAVPCRIVPWPACCRRHLAVGGIEHPTLGLGTVGRWLAVRRAGAVGVRGGRQDLPRTRGAEGPLELQDGRLQPRRHGVGVGVG